MEKASDMTRFRLVEIGVLALETTLVSFAGAGVAGGLLYRLGDAKGASGAFSVATFFAAMVMISAAITLATRRLRDE